MGGIKTKVLGVPDTNYVWQKGNSSSTKKELPVKLPDVIDMNTKGNPLDHNVNWKNINLDGKSFIRETDTLDTFVDFLVFFKILFT